ncbi:cytochrome c-type biogenesis protein F [Candidatus Photodesmus blepharus]|uniref:Cytochrome c-type biogenesis protein F n=1 Tax=Candidatus Photodesmus blepharonis TaxID=1179155 RepID=A0A084CMX7_9GAMM|nr:heme lyase CcmF/NrfE family subunit [Candidatus Photodesmus blepharus]KEY91156.1 cytochrome c-type biogenesis protein F [Candidatus Photodesmus blepharus]
MTAEIGHFSLILSLSMAILLSVLPLIGLSRGNVILIDSAKPLSFGTFCLILVSFVTLLWAFYTHDFTLSYVVMNSNTQLPWYYRLSATWGAHEGSLLLWVLIQAGWTLSLAIFSPGIPQKSIAHVLSIMGMITAGLLLFIIMTSNPFLRTLPFFPVDGNDLNPFLQDVGLIFHPPILYMGYVGFSVAFSFAIASLMIGNFDTSWFSWSRPWTTTAWLFLTLGITLGSWWAYYELGWGGWWFWDPVENASLMPWLAGTALMHSLIVTEKRGTFQIWTILLAISTFSLSLLGTFLVRSGILISVHTFASDPSRGMFILLFLVCVIGGSLLLFALKVKKVRVQGNFELISRESMLLGNNVLFIAALVVVLVGTLLPLVHKQIGLGSLSVGAPFFNILFAWLMIPFSFFLGIAPIVRWKRDRLSRLIKPVLIAGLISLIFGALVIFFFLEHHTSMVYAGLVMVFWVVILHFFGLYERIIHCQNFIKGINRLKSTYWAMMFAHIGLAITVIGIVIVENYSIERDVKLALGERFQIRDYEFYFQKLRNKDGPNYEGYIADFEVSQRGRYINTLQAEKRFYTTSHLVTTEVAIDVGIMRDLYIAMGDRLDEKHWAVRVHYKPFIRWIWIGSLFMVLGGLISVFGRRKHCCKLAETGSW